MDMITTQPKKKKPLALIISSYVVLLLVIAAGIYFLKSYLPQKPSSCSYDKDVCSFLTVLSDPQKNYAGPFTASIVTTKPDKSVSRIIIRSDRNKNMDIIYYNDNKFSGESIIIGNTQYIKNLKTNTWTKSANPPDMTFFDFKQKSLDAVNKKDNGVVYTFSGTNDCAKKTCMTYLVTTPTSGATKTYVLFTQTTHMLKEVITKAPDTTTTATLFLYTPVMITPPVTK